MSYNLVDFKLGFISLKVNMKNNVAITIFAIIVLGILVYSFYSNESDIGGTSTDVTDNNAPTNSSNENQASPDNTDTIDATEGLSAAQVYQSSSEALEAIKKGALNYDDDILQRFVNLKNCEWCGDFYTSVRQLLLDNSISLENKGYFAELLAVSGTTENVGFIIDTIKNTQDEQSREIFGEALEFTSGGDDIVPLLSANLRDSNKILQDSVASALTNQGSKSAADALYQWMSEAKNGDDLYQRGIGLGEFVPTSEEVFPFLQEKLLLKDENSHLALKAMLNGGSSGLKKVIESLENSDNNELDKKLLENSIDHIGDDDETRELIKVTAATSKNPALKEFAEAALKEFALLDSEDSE